VAGIGWYALLDEPPAPPDSANWGLMTNDLRRKPSYRAMTRAPSMGLRPRVSVAPRIARSALAAPGLAVSLTARRSGTITLELRRGSELVGNLLVRVQKGRRRVVRLRLRGASRAAYTVVVRSARGATVRRGLRVR
jgi:hypothetical protein